MTTAIQVIDEMLPMVTEFITDLGMDDGGIVNFEHALKPLSDWITKQDIKEVDFYYLSSRVAAFFCHYYVQECGASIRSIENSILLRLSIGDGIYQNIDPYFFTIMIVKKEITLVEAIDANVCCNN